MLKLVCIALTLVVLEVSGHGMMLDPPNRSSLWRFDEEAPINYNDNENFCGGIGVLWDVNGGKCGVCGDVYTDPHPQANENTGIYGTGKVVANYTAGQIIETSIRLTANHLGHFEYHLCELNNPNSIESGDECFQPLAFEDGTFKYTVVGELFDIVNHVQLPEGFTCERCVLRWHYRGANNWGDCDDGVNRPGCGPQEWFRSCSDIAIF